MAQCKQSPQEFIKNAFTPQIAVMCTPEAEKCCLKNNLNFVELLQPFSRLNNDVHFIDPSGLDICVRNLKLSFLDITWKPPQTSVARKLLNSSVTIAAESRNKIFHVGKFKLDIPASTPWYESWREIFLKVQYPSDHEFTKHFLACMLVISSSDPDPVQSFKQLEQSLTQLQNATPGKLPKWFNSNILKYYLVIHDTFEGNTEEASKGFDAVKTTYGAQNCFLLKMNSRPPNISMEHLADPWNQFVTDENFLKESKNNSSDDLMQTSLEIGREAEESKPLRDDHPLSPLNEDFTQSDFTIEDDVLTVPVKPTLHGACLSTDDIEQVKLLVYEFVKSCLIPYVEKQIGVLHEIISNKKGVSKSLFSATKRWFSSNKPGVNTPVNNLIYSLDSPELQVRQLGDLLFMFSHYAGAFQAYHLAKRDYSADQAWLYYAGALEMAALSAFMGGEPTRKTCDYMEESINTYLYTCKMPQFATRATILSSECLKHQHMYGDAALQLIRMTSEESDLRSALLLEQAAYCFLQSKMVRKYAFHMVLAGHRFSKAAQRKHSLKCYKQAYQIYQDTQWDLALDHIYYTIGKQANNLQLFDESVESFSKLLKGESKQLATQQAMFLNEYLTVLVNKRRMEGEGDHTSIPILPVPNFESDSIKVLLGPTGPLSTPGKIPASGINFDNLEDSQVESKWIKLEQMLVQENEGSLPVIFKPMMALYNVNALEKNMPISVINEPIQVSLRLINTLQTILNLKDIYLLWCFNTENEVVSNEILDEHKDQFVKTHVTKCFTIPGGAKQDIVLTLTPLVIGNITITSFCYTLSGTSTNNESNNLIKGKMVLSIPQHSNKHGENGQKNIEIKIVPPAPALQVTFSEINSNILTDEIQRVTVDFCNSSTVALQNVCIATSVPHLLSTEFQKPNNQTLDFNLCNTPALKEKFMRKNHVLPVPLMGNVLEPGQKITVHLWIKAPNVRGPATIDLLIYYENVIRTNIPRYRLVRHSWNLTVQESIAVDVTTQASHSSKSIEELALAVKITNLNKVYYAIPTEVTLLNVALLSKNWALTKDIVTPKFINLHSQESAHILMKAKRSVKKHSEYSNILLNTDTKMVQNLAKVNLSFARNVEKPLLNIFETNLENFTYKESDDGILLLQWQALVIDNKNRHIVYGQSHVPVKIVRKEEDILQLETLISTAIINIADKEEDPAQIAQNQVSYNLFHTPVVKHNFKKEHLCIVPLKLFIHSIVSDGILSVAVNTIEPSAKSTINKSNLFYAYASRHFTWLGNSKIIKTLQPLKTTSVQLSVAITSPGTFDLGAHIEVLCKKLNSSESSYVSQSCQIHSALMVVNTEE